MIPKEVIDVTNSQYFAYLGSRDGQLAPTVRMTWGVDFAADEDIATSFVIQAQYEQMLNNFQQNGRIALSYSDLSTHVAYQLKGHFLQARPLTEEEVALQQQYRREIINFLTEFAGYPEERLNVVAHLADLAIDLKVEKIFNQTPGPGAGKEITF
jgi:hypothetical protein